MKGLESQEGYQNEYLNLSFLLFIVITVFSIILPKTWGVIVLCVGFTLLSVLLIRSYIYDAKRIKENTLQTIKEEEPKGN
ncbi:MAG: hypothetical protein AMK69_24125 [Nitrospira bacterium SG8_3]|nr:MAG: hypothetical protein AMK69_24125 [Nitrospira bacterium SG8_3]